MKRLIKIICAGFVVAVTLSASVSQALVCPDPRQGQGTTWCDAEPGRFVDDTVCLVEPLDGSLPNGIDQEVSGSGVCVLGKFQDPTDLEHLVDVVIAYDLVSAPQDPLSVLDASGVEVPGIEALNASAGEFLTTLPLAEPGVYNVLLQLRLLQDDGSFRDIPINRRILRVAAPHLTVKRARFGGVQESCEAGEEGCLGVNESTTPGMNVSDSPVHSVTLTPPAGQSGFSAATSVDLCIGGHDDEPGAGSNLTVTATNTITDADGERPREALIESRCEVVDGQSSCIEAAFCPGGTMINVPIGHGTNKIDLYIDNALTAGFGHSEYISVDTFDVDLKGPQLCVNYLDEAGHVIEHVDGSVLLASEAADYVTVDVTLGACGGDVATLSAEAQCDAANPGVDGDGEWPVTMRMQNDGAALRMCAKNVNGVTHYQARFNALRYPVNTATIQVVDDEGNKTIETHSFGYGEVRSLFDANGNLKMKDAVTPAGLGGFVPTSYLQGGLLDLVETVANSQKFKDDILLGMLSPAKPISDDELLCHRIYNKDVTNIRTFKLYNETFGDISVPSLHLLNDGSIWMQLKIAGLHGDAEFQTIEFKDTDGDGYYDADGRDEDADDDGCEANKFTVRTECDPDGTLCDDGDDLDEDCDLVPDEFDLPGYLIPDPIFGFDILPGRIKIKEMAINLQLRMLEENGQLRVEVSNVPGRDLVEAIPDKSRFVEINCSQDLSFTSVERETASGTIERGPIRIDKEVCNSLKSLEGELNNEGISPTDVNQTVDQQLINIMNSMLRCSLPARISSELQRFEATRGVETEPVIDFSLDVNDKQLGFEMFVPLLSSEVRIDSTGVGFSGGGLLLTSGTGEADSDQERSATTFMQELPEELRHSKMGPLYPATDVMPPDPIVASKETGRPLALAIKEETVNSLLHAVGLSLWDLARLEGESGGKQSLDLTMTELRDLGLGIPDIGSSVCTDEDGKTVPSDSWKCFPFPLNIQNVLGPGILTFVDFDGDGIPGTSDDDQTPLVIRTGINPQLPPTVRLVDASSFGGWDGSGASRPSMVMLELEIGLGDAELTLFEEAVQDRVLDPQTGELGPLQGKNEIKSWCDGETRFPGMNPKRCDPESGEMKTDMPIASFGVSGRVFVTVLASIQEDGILRIEGGLSSVEKSGQTNAGTRMELDRDKTFLEFSVRENNTIVPDPILAGAIQGSINTILPEYVFGNARSVSVEIPTMLGGENHALGNFCAVFPEVDDICDCVKDPNQDGCDLVESLQDVWDDIGLEDFDIAELILREPLMGLTGAPVGDTRYLTIGTELGFEATR